MIDKLSNMLCLLVLATAFVVAGCQQEYRGQAAGFNPLADPNFVMPDYASGAIEATGGRQAWTKAEKLRVDGVVTFYQPDGSFCLTEQHYEIYPWSNSIRISAAEPQGKLIWELSEGMGQFSVLADAEQVCALPISLSERRFAEGILYITTAPARFLDKRFEFRKSPDPAKIQGCWYYPIELVSCEVTETVPIRFKVVFYQSSDSSLIDMIWYADFEREEFLMVRGYDYREVERGPVWLPAKIEIFKTDAQGVLQQRMVKIDFYE